MKKNKFYWKSIIIIFGTNIFIYFFSKYIESGFHYLAIPFDDKIPFLPGFMYIYMIWYPFIMTILYFIYKYDKDKYLHTIIALVLSLVTTYFFFIFYPTAVVRPEVNSFHNVTTFVTYVVFKSDTPYNCFPSAHCLLCFLLSFSVFKDNKIPKKIRYITIILSCLIVLATLFTKQHVVLDVVGALILSIIMYYFVSNLKYFDKIKKKMKHQMD